MLYQRYFLRMNQSNINHLLSLLLVMVLALTTLFIVFTALNIDNYYRNGAEEGSSVEYNISTTIEFQQSLEQQQQQQLTKDDYFTTNNLTTGDGASMGTIAENSVKQNSSRKWQRRKRKR